MGTKNAKVEATAVKVAKPKKFRRAIRLVDEASNGLAVIVTEAVVNGKPGFRSAVVHRADKTHRAMIAFHDTREAANVRAEQLAREAEGLGWVLKARAQKPPAFVTLPAPAKGPAVVKPIRKSA